MHRLAILLSILALITWPAALPAAAAAARFQATDVVLKNQYVEAHLNPRGMFNIGTAQGDPAAPEDDNKRLVYGFGRDYYTSFTSVRITAGGETHDIGLLQGNDAPPQVTGDAATTRWTFDNITIQQTLSPATNPFTNRPDTFKIETTVSNKGSSTAQVGVRVMIDTMIGDNDRAPFFVPGTGNLAEEREYTGAAVPPYWKAFEAPDYNPASLKGQGILTGFGATPPDRFVMARWPRIKNTMWDYEVQPGASVGDSAVGIYWQPKDMPGGATATYVTYYGLAGAGGGQAWIDAPVSVTSQAPGLEATLWVANRSDGDFTDGDAAVDLPAGLRLAPGEAAHKPMQRVPAGGAQSVTWRLVADGRSDTDYPYSATATFRQGSGPLSATSRLSYRYLAPTATPLPTAPPTAAPSPTPTSRPTVVPVPVTPPPPAAVAPLWPWLLIPLLGIPLLWLLFRRRSPAPRVAPPVHAPPPPRPVMFDRTPPPRSGPTGADVTHGRRKPPRQRE